jgi:aspartyl-tRNA(Asn)/glutamyl-tRNA(Gln) amidotransferase subunit B
MSEYKTVIGLEVHVQLATESKLFCGCSTQFGAPSNTQTCPVCLGLPGALPVMNEAAYQLALQTAVALNCTIPAITKWDRKQYYYPDLPKGYQISQYDLPMSQDGYLVIDDPKDRFAPKRVRIIRAHLEEDAGKSIHDEVAGRADSQIDLNRTGTPLLEIVTHPDMNSPLEARTFLNELKLLLTYIGVSDCNMQEGSLRVDANVNLNITVDGHAVATPIVEIKNMNSFRAVERALAYEAERQFGHWRETHQSLGDVPKQTRGWDDAAGVTRPQRSKEESSDYRYFPDPDLLPVTASSQQVDTVRAGLGELPAALQSRLEADYGLGKYDADVIVNQGRPVVEYYEAVAQQSGDFKAAANWVTQDVLRALKEQNLDISAFSIPAHNLAALVAKISEGVVPSARSRDVYLLMLESGVDVDVAVAELGIERIDQSELLALCQDLLKENPKIVADVQLGNAKAVGALIGMAKRRNPNVDPTQIREMCLRLIEEGAVAD